MGFLYFISDDQRPPNPEKLRKWGLAYAFTRTPEHRPINSKSPSGKSGGIIADSERMPGKVAGYHPDEQTWRKLPNVEGRPEIWVGYWNDSKPGPEDLRRANMLRGPKITLADGNAWQIPIVRRFDDAAQRWESELPAYLDYDDAGKVTKGQPLEEYTRLWDLTAPLADQQFAKDSDDEGATGPTDEDIFTAVVALLQANYIVDMPELVAIRALQENDLATICMVACRYAELMSWIEDDQKKTEPSDASGSNTTDGKAA